MCSCHRQGSQAEYVIHIRVVASHEYVNTYSTRRMSSERIFKIARSDSANCEKRNRSKRSHDKNKVTDRPGE